MIHFNRPKDKLNLFMKKFTPLVFLSVLLIISGCSSSDTGDIETKTFTTELSRTTLSFGNVEVTNTAKETFAVTNTGTEEISISNITTPEGFNVTPSSGSITAGNSKIFTVAFTPTESKTYNGNLVITSNSNSTLSSIIMAGIGVNSNASIYNQYIKPIITPNCVNTDGCHSSSDSSGGVDLSTYEKVLDDFQYNSEDRSMAQIISGKMPQNAAKLSEDDISLLQSWVDNNFESVGMPTFIVTVKTAHK